MYIAGRLYLCWDRNPPSFHSGIQNEAKNNDTDTDTDTDTTDNEDLIWDVLILRQRTKEKTKINWEIIFRNHISVMLFRCSQGWWWYNKDKSWRIKSLLISWTVTGFLFQALFFLLIIQGFQKQGLSKKKKNLFYYNQFHKQSLPPQFLLNIVLSPNLISILWDYQILVELCPF